MTSAISGFLSETSVDEGRTAHVQLSNELVNLLSEQLYQSPTKAIEELIVNAYDANASVCRVFVPDPAERLGDGARPYITVFDDGEGMDAAGLEALWRVGRSDKQHPASQAKLKRKLIGKFGIGKLAANAVGHRLTYVSKRAGEIRTVSVDFRQFASSAKGSTERVDLPLRRIESIERLMENSRFVELLTATHVAEQDLKGPHWTLAVIEDLKEKLGRLRTGRLRWVISTALPLRADFKTYLNGAEVESSKAQLKPIVEFDIAGGDADLKPLRKATGVDWQIVDGKLVSAAFPQGIRGSALVTSESLYGKKSDDIARSHGFFVRVHDRLINLLDPEFGLSPRSFTTFYSFRADIWVDDLQPLISSTREDIRDSPEKEQVQAVLLWIFQRATREHQRVLEEEERKQETKRETERDYIGPRLFEQPLADFLASAKSNDTAEPDGDWFYVEVPEADKRQEVIRALLGSPRGRYVFEYASSGVNSRFVRFDPSTGRFTINEDHEFAREHCESGRAQVLLEDMATAEVLLEVYLRRHGVSPVVIGDVLEQRDRLLRTLAKDRRFSLSAIAQALRESADDERHLEIALVGAARALGFVARHVSNADQPDGVARLRRYPGGDVTITLEAKSSASTPQLGQLDFGGLQAHMRQHNAVGCLLLAPAYPGSSRGSDSQAAQRAQQTRVSCWTVEALAKVVAVAESRQITAAQILEIITTQFAPDDVSRAVDALLAQPQGDFRMLYLRILEALAEHRDDAADVERTVGLVAGWVTAGVEFRGTRMETIANALRQMAAASKGAMEYRPGGSPSNGVILLFTSAEELARRLEGITGVPGFPRKRGARRNGDDEVDER